jgi:hypothetical protein
MYFLFDYGLRPQYRFAILAPEGRLLEAILKAERGVAVPRRRLATVCPGRLGTPPCGHYDPRARSSLEPIRLLAEAQA